MKLSSRCAVRARADRAEVVGSVTCAHGVLLVEHPLPWPADPLDAPGLAWARPHLDRRAAQGRRYRLQLVCPPDGRVDRSAVRVVFYARPPGPFSGFVGRELVVPAADVADAAAALVADRPPLTAARPPVDVLLCTHGTRDVCCGSRGAALAREVALDRARLWRTSHLGGHRFAPTALVLPRGTAWAFLDADALRAVVAERLPRADIRSRFRGTLGFCDEAVQVVEREALCRWGWPWLTTPRTVEAVASEGDGRWSVLVSCGASGATRIVSAEVVAHDGPLLAPCGESAPLTRDRSWTLERLTVRLTGDGR